MARRPLPLMRTIRPFTPAPAPCPAGFLALLYHYYDKRALFTGDLTFLIAFV